MEEVKKPTKRYESTKYGFSQMAVGEERGIKIGRFGSTRLLNRLKAACKMETRKYKTTWVTRRTDSHIYYKRTA